MLYRGRGYRSSATDAIRLHSDIQLWPWNQAFKEIKPGAPNWKASVTQVSKMAGSSREEILGRITSKFNITRENFDELLRAANHRVAA